MLKSRLQGIIVLNLTNLFAINSPPIPNSSFCQKPDNGSCVNRIKTCIYHIKTVKKYIFAYFLTTSIIAFILIKVNIQFVQYYLQNTHYCSVFYNDNRSEHIAADNTCSSDGVNTI